MTRPTILPRKLGEISRHYTAFVAIGFPVTLEGNAETLQLVTERDATNWLTVYGICLEAIGAGLSDLTLSIFTTSERAYTMTFAQCAWMLGEMRSWGIAADANHRRLIALAKAAEDNAALNAIDITAGYP